MVAQEQDSQRHSYPRHKQTQLVVVVKAQDNMCCFYIAQQERPMTYGCQVQCLQLIAHVTTEISDKSG